MILTALPGSSDALPTRRPEDICSWSLASVADWVASAYTVFEYIEPHPLILGFLVLANLL
jgi:hypothetical protein